MSGGQEQTAREMQMEIARMRVELNRLRAKYGEMDGCGFGAQFANDNRFRILRREYPKCYDMVMNYTNNGVTFRDALRKVLAVNRLYLPDEQPPTLFDKEFINPDCPCHKEGGEE